MTTNNKIVKKLTRSAELKAAHINARRRLRYAEKRCERTRAAAVAANANVEEASRLLLRLLGEIKLHMKAVAKAGHCTSTVPHLCAEVEMSDSMSRLAANEVAKFLSSTGIHDATHV